MRDVEWQGVAGAHADRCAIDDNVEAQCIRFCLEHIETRPMAFDVVHQSPTPPSVDIEQSDRVRARCRDGVCHRTTGSACTNDQYATPGYRLSSRHQTPHESFTIEVFADQPAIVAF